MLLILEKEKENYKLDKMSMRSPPNRRKQMTFKQNTYLERLDLNFFKE